MINKKQLPTWLYFLIIIILLFIVFIFNLKLHSNVQNETKTEGPVVLVYLKNELVNDSNVTLVNIKTDERPYIFKKINFISGVELNEASLIKDNNNNSIFDSADSVIADFIKRTDREYQIKNINEVTIGGNNNYFIIADKKLHLMEMDFEFLNQSKITVKPKTTRFIDEATLIGLYNSTLDINQFLAQNSNFNKIKTEDENIKIISLGPGTFNFMETTIIPKGVHLKILPGTNLRFGENVFFISYGSIEAIGTSFAPITFSSNGNHNWGSAAVLETGEKVNYFKWVIVEKSNGGIVNGILLTGGLAAHHANVDIANSIFRDNHGDDGVNVKYASVKIINNKFTGNEFDGLDLDITKGEVSNNIFSNNGNDGLDLSFCDLKVEDNLIFSNFDKGISVGEETKVEIVENIIRKSQIGIAVKDGSVANLSRNTIENNEIGLDVYVKKPYFGKAQAILNQNYFNENIKDYESDDQSLINYVIE